MGFNPARGNMVNGALNFDLSPGDLITVGGSLHETKYSKKILQKKKAFSNKMKERFQCYTILCYAILYHAMPCHTMPYHTVPYYTMADDFQWSILGPISMH